MIRELRTEVLPPEDWGNKAANLAKLLAAGLVVPPALCVQEGDLTASGNSLFLLRWLASVREDRVVLRCSTQDEDTRSTARAGHTLSLLNVPRSAQHIRRAVVTEIEPVLAGHTGGKSCIIQGQVSALVGGVAFRDETSLRVEGNYYSTEATTAGQAPNIVFTEQHGGRRWQYDYAPGIPLRRLGDALSFQTALVYDLFDHSVDVEWAFDGSVIYILQARPITATLSERIADDL